MRLWGINPINSVFNPQIAFYYPKRRSVWENLDQGLEYRLNAVSSVHMTEVESLPYSATKLSY